MNWALELSRATKPSAGQANLYGVILFTDAHAYVKKVVADDDFWRALDELSGPRWAVFSIRAQPGSYQLPDVPPGSMGLLIPVWKEPSANRDLLEAFEIESTERLPVLVVFAEDDGGTLYRRLVPIRGQTQEEVFASLRETMTLIAGALERVDDSNRRAGAQAFHAVGYSLKGSAEWNALKKGLAVWQWLRSLS